MLTRVLTFVLILSLTMLVACGDDSDPIDPGDTTAPSTVGDLAVDAFTASTVTLTWTAPGDDGDTGTADAYDLRLSNEAITFANWDDATIVPGLSDPLEAGSVESFTVTGLDPETEYHFAILATDEAANASGISGDIMATTLSAPVIVSVDPPDGSSDIGMMTMFTIEFDRPMDPATLIPENVDILVREFDKAVDYSLDFRTMYVTPRPSLVPELSLGLQLNMNIRGQDGLAIVPQTFTYETGPDDCEHWADRFEPNEDWNEATPIVLDRAYPSLATCEDDVDTYSFTLDEHQMVTIYTPITHVIPDPEDEDEYTGWQLHWMRQDGVHISTCGTEAATGETPEFHHSFLPGTYLVEVYSSENEVRVLYDLELVTSDPCADDVYEDNDFREDAVMLTPGLHEGLSACFLDADWYSLSVTTGQTFTITADTGDYDDLRRVAAYEPGGGFFSETEHSTTTQTYSLDITADGTLDFYFITWDDGVTYDMELILDE